LQSHISDFEEKDRNKEYDPETYRKMGVSLVSEHDLKHLDLKKYLKNSSRLPDNDLNMLVGEVSQRSLIAYEANKSLNDPSEMKYDHHYVTTS